MNQTIRSDAERKSIEDFRAAWDKTNETILRQRMVEAGISQLTEMNAVRRFVRSIKLDCAEFIDTLAGAYPADERPTVSAVADALRLVANE